MQELPSGALRVSVYAGIDPITKRRHYLRETVPPGPGTAAEAERVMRRLAGQVDERRHPRTSATVDQLLEKHFDMVTLERSTLAAYQGYVRKHISPLLGSTQLGALDADIFDSFYAELRRCRDHCARKRQIDHRTPLPHECDHRCTPHTCRPLSAATIRHVHFILSGALKRAVRWRWIATNPIEQAEPPPAPKPNPRPPTAEEAARILEDAWSDPDWGTLVWLLMVTGIRRGELCALRWRDIDLNNAVISLDRSIGQYGSETWEKDTKTHQHRRIALDPETVQILTEHRDRWSERLSALDGELSAEAFVFSIAPDASTHLRPNSVSERYGDMAARLDIRTSLHKLRHYSATELIAAGVDIRTVAGRLGHSGGGTTTLRTYAAWMSESDQRAVQNLVTRLPPQRRGPPPPPRPEGLAPPPEALDPQYPYEILAAQLRVAIEDETYAPGSFLPGVKVLAKQHEIAVSTAHRAVSLLADWGLVVLVPARGFQVTEPSKPADAPTQALALLPPTTEGAGQSTASTSDGRTLLALTVLRSGEVLTKFSAAANPFDADDLQDLLTDAVRRKTGDATQVADCEMEVRRVGESELLMTFVAPRLRSDSR